MSQNTFQLAEILVLAGTAGAGEMQRQLALGSLLGLNVFRDTVHPRICTAHAHRVAISEWLAGSDFWFAKRANVIGLVCSGPAAGPHDHLVAERGVDRHRGHKLEHEGVPRITRGRHVNDDVVTLTCANQKKCS